MKWLFGFLLCMALGVGAGVFYAWVISPVKYTDTSPISLRADYKAEYIQLVAEAYAADQDIGRARARLSLLGEVNLSQTVTALAQRTAGSGGDPQTVKALSALAMALGVKPASPTPRSTLVTPTPTLTPTPTPTRLPTATPQLLPTRAPTATPIGAFQPSSQEFVCDNRLTHPLIQVFTVDASGVPIAGVEVIVEWSEGTDRFFTGLKPELGAGYGDFAMQADTDYVVRLAASPAAVFSGLNATGQCDDGTGRKFPGSWQVTFRQP